MKRLLTTMAIAGAVGLAWAQQAPLTPISGGIEYVILKHAAPAIVTSVKLGDITNILHSHYSLTVKTFAGVIQGQGGPIGGIEIGKGHALSYFADGTPQIEAWLGFGLVMANSTPMKAGVFCGVSWRF